MTKKNSERIKEVDIQNERRNRLINWVTFYRRNIHRFIEHYFGIGLYAYQIPWVYTMSVADSYVSICSRAVGKTWLLAVLACARAVLYPNSKVVVVASTKQQAGIIVEEKISELYNDYPNLRREISNITTNMNKWAVDFYNGSKIVIVASRDSSRGKRSTFTIYEEFRLIEKEVVDSVIRQFSFVRQPPYLKNKKYSHLLEEPKEIFISSAYHKGLWWFDETKKNIIGMVAGKNMGFIAIDYSVAVRHGIKTVRQMLNEMSKMEEIALLEEVYNIPWGENAKAYFKLSMFMSARNTSQAFYPQRNDNFKAKRNPYAISKMEGEVRIVSCDIATRSGKANDLAITSCIRLIPTNKGYLRELVYMESFSGVNSISQGIRIKQIYYDFDSDYIVLDIANAGITIYDVLGQLTKDPERGEEYPPLTIMEHESIARVKRDELRTRTLGLNALPVIYTVSVDAKTNSEIAVEMRDKLQKKMWSFLLDEKEADKFLINSKYKKDFNTQDSTMKAWFLAPYVQTSLMVNECINLSMKLHSGHIQLLEESGNRKDRYTSISYGNYFASFLDKNLVREVDEADELELWLSYTSVR